MKLHSRLARAFAACVIISQTVALVAQQTSAPPAAAGDEEEGPTITLNPFVIVEETDTWNATQTLAGSRLKTDLTDVASQVEVMTMDFMDAFALNSIEEAAIYSLNVESPQENTGVGISGLGNDDLRVRGISNATRSREFFSTSIGTDNYNLTRVSISSGPNAILFGTGSAAGTVDSTISRAQTQKNFGEFGVQFDDWGGHRFQFDYNYVIKEDALAVRVAALKHHRAFTEDKAFIDNDRLYATFTLKPFPKTTITGHGEWIGIESRRPARTVPFDRISTYYTSDELLRASGLVDAENPTIPDETLFDNGPAWVAANRALTRNQDALLDLGGNAITLLGGPASGLLATPRSWFYSVTPSSVSPNDFLSIYETVNRDSNGTTLLNDDYFPRDYHTIKNLRADNDQARILNLFVNQEIAKGLYFDFGYHHEKNDIFNHETVDFFHGYEILADNNLYLPSADGGMEPNPMVGQLYVDGYQPNYDRGEYEGREWRAALSYEFDVRDWTKSKLLGILGRHRLAGMYLDRREENMSQSYKLAPMPEFVDGVWQDGDFPGFPYNPLDTRRALAGLGVPGVSGDTQSGAFDAEDRWLGVRTYFGFPGAIDYPQLPAGLVPGQPYTITDQNGVEFVIDPENAANGTNGERLTIGNPANGTLQTLETTQFSWQGFFWDDRIVATFGWRKDTLNTAEEDTAAVDPLWKHPETGEIMNSSAAVFRVPFQEVPFQPFDPAAESSGRTKLRGVVVHPFRGWDAFKLPLGTDISFSYNKSDTFQPNTNERNPNGTFIPGETGEGEDFGIRISTFDGRLSLRYNYYETMAGPTKLFLPFRRWRFRWREGGGMRDVITMLADSDKAIFDRYFPNPEDWPLRATDPSYDEATAYPFGVRDGGFPTGNFNNYADPYTFTADSEAKGHEVSIAWAPNRNWNIRATWNQQEVIQSNLGAQWFQFTEEFETIMDRTRFIEGYVPGVQGLSGWDDPNGRDMDGMDLDPNDGLPPGIDYFTWDQIPFGGNGNGRPIVTTGPWGQNADAFPGGWTRQTMKDRHFTQVVNSNNGTSVLRAFDGKPNDFLRENRLNINAQYRFTEGRLKGLRVGGAYRYRKGAGIGLGTQIINGELVPDTNIILPGPDSNFFDLSFDYRGRTDLFGWFGSDTGYSVGLTVRNIFDEGPFEPELIDADTRLPTNYLRVDGRQFVLSAGLEF